MGTFTSTNFAANAQLPVVTLCGQSPTEITVATRSSARDIHLQKKFLLTVAV